MLRVGPLKTWWSYITWAIYIHLPNWIVPQLQLFFVLYKITWVKLTVYQ